MLPVALGAKKAARGTSGWLSNGADGSVWAAPDALNFVVR